MSGVHIDSSDVELRFHLRCYLESAAERVNCCRVRSGTRMARAISAGASPATARRVKATWASTPRAGWQHIKISVSWSSSRPLAG